MIFNNGIKVRIANRGVVVAVYKFKVMPGVGDIYYHEELDRYGVIKSISHVCYTGFFTVFHPKVEVEFHDKSTPFVY